ncbi:MAG: acyltransferase [Chitinophagia bacterium]|jgi:acetyltransferase-like isoleucine patch superfamily enzyme|nr:acyltransferase [Chitinophagia bacterium]
MKNQLNNRFQTGWSNQNKMITYYYLFFFFIRGLFVRLRIKSAKGLLLVGKKVRIFYPNNLQVGYNTIIEDGAEINCLSLQGIKLGNRVTIGKYAIIRPSNIYGGPIGEGLTMGNNSNIGPYNYIGCSGKITIGNNVMLAPRVSIYAENHVFDHPEVLIRDQGVEKKEVIIEDDCWIAANSILLAGVTIGKGSVVAAGSVVTENVPPYSVVAGVPAKWIKSRK